MKDPEIALISKVAATPGALERALSRGIRDEHFADEQCQQVWRSILGHVRRYKSSPSLDRVRVLHPDFRPELSSDTLDFICDAFIRQAKRRFTLQSMYELSDIIDEGDEDAIDRLDELFQEKARELALLVPSSHAERFSHMDRRQAAYWDRKFNQKVKRNVLTGIPFIDKRTMGIQPHDFTTIVGWSSIGKSTLAQYVIFNAYVDGKTPLMISLEMEADALFRKWDTMAAGFEYAALKAMELGQGDMARWEEQIERARKAPNDIIVIDRLSNCNVETVYAETMRYGPDLVCIDYITLMDWAQGRRVQMWEGVTQLTKGLKANARTLKIPVLAIAQTNIGGAQEGAKAENIAYSRSIFQDSDIVLGLHQTDQMREHKKMTIRLLKNRDGATGECEYYWDMERMNFHDWSVSDMFRPRPVEGEADGAPLGDPTDPREAGA